MSAPGFSPLTLGERRRLDALEMFGVLRAARPIGDLDKLVDRGIAVALRRPDGLEYRRVK